jgi:hypothetical protein
MTFKLSSGKLLVTPDVAKGKKCMSVLSHNKVTTFPALYDYSYSLKKIIG